MLKGNSGKFMNREKTTGVHRERRNRLFIIEMRGKVRDERRKREEIRNLGETANSEKLSLKFGLNPPTGTRCPRAQIRP